MIKNIVQCRGKKTFARGLVAALLLTCGVSSIGIANADTSIPDVGALQYQNLAEHLGPNLMPNSVFEFGFEGITPWGLEPGSEEHVSLDKMENGEGYYAIINENAYGLLYGTPKLDMGLYMASVTTRKNSVNTVQGESPKFSVGGNPFGIKGDSANLPISDDGEFKTTTVFFFVLYDGQVANITVNRSLNGPSNVGEVAMDNLQITNVMVQKVLPD